MRLWGKVMSGSLLVFAAVFAGVGLFTIWPMVAVLYLLLTFP